MKKNELKEERMKILEMLSKKIITADEAEKLLSSLNQDDDPIVLEPKKSQFKMLKINVLSSSGDDVNIQIPIEFAKLLKNKKFLSNYSDDFIWILISYWK